MPTATSNSAASAFAAVAQASDAASPPTHAAAAAGDNDSAALLWTLRANAVTPSKSPAASSSSSSTAAVAFTTPATTSSAPRSTNMTLSAAPSSALKAVGSATPPSATRRGPGRPKKSESNSKNAAKWDDTVTSLLLKFRFDDMRQEFEGVRNNVEVGECWIQLAQTISRLSGKSFDSHQCQSKLRNLKKSWREMSSSSRVVASTISPLYPLLSQYLGGGSSTDNTTTTTANSTNNSHEGTAASLEVLETGGSVAASRRTISGAGDEAERVEVVVSDSEGGRHAIANEAGAGDAAEEARQIIGSSSSAVEESPPGADLSLGVIDADDDAADAETNKSTQIRLASKNSVTSRSRSDSGSSSSSSSSLALAPSKRQKTSSHAPTASAASDAAADTLVPTASTIVATATAPILSGGQLQTNDGRIDSSLLSVANGLRTMMEGVIASKEESSEQQSILAELREHNALMKQYCEEVSKQTTSLNALIDLLAAKFGNE